ncbi:SH3 and PX domain-containing protein 2B-like [Pseudoliparis swirei]|uniref:SH3 and PX domain-containing protein 2B-like n=1 Tax=Pseudoliparis swirei TaxID=2059687 RepID=UPI0024BECE2E|nr:SH3 and PX domain-containing protein 2B-like [Pseudoliparis swirei]
MKFLESYCDKLLKCDPTVTQSSMVFQFFVPKDHDLQSDFTKNSIMILLSDDLPDGSGEGGSDLAGSVTHPFVTQTYRCVAAYETKDTKNRPFKTSVDEKLDVLIKDPTGWWLVENEDKLLAWFPAPYLELWEGEDDEDAGFQLAGALYCAVRSYSTKKDDEVSVLIGSVVEVLRKSDNGWWLIRFNGKSGYIPSMNLKPYNNPRAGLYSLQRKLHSSTLNLATGMEPQAPRPPGSNNENRPRLYSLGQTTGEPSVPGHLQKARSLDVLSENWSPTLSKNDASNSDSRARSPSNTSNESSFSDYSSSESSTPTDSRTASFQPGSSDLTVSDRRGSNTSLDSSKSLGSKGSEAASITPRVPPRPKTEEILTRCTTMTRKAALANKTRLQISRS